MDSSTAGQSNRASASDRSKRIVLRALGGASPGERSGGGVERFLLILIFLNVIALMVETVPTLPAGVRQILAAFEVVSVAAFTAEYVLRLWACTASPAFRHPVWGRLRFALTPLAIVDLLAILPFYLPSTGLDLRFARAVRLLRAFRIFKLGRYSAALTTIARVLRSRRAELGGTLMILLVLLVLASSLMYFAEHEAQPVKFSSIPATMWWGIITITTIGYGDMYPVTAAGKFVAGIIAVIGIGTFALPTSILGAAFLEDVQVRARNAAPSPHSVCPHCQKPLDGAEHAS